MFAMIYHHKKSSSESSLCAMLQQSVTKALQNSTYLHTILHLIPSCQLQRLQKDELVSY